MIQITKVTQPEQGAIVMAHCVACQMTTITLSRHANRPREGDLWFLEGVCIDDIHLSSINQRPYFADTVSR